MTKATKLDQEIGEKIQIHRKLRNKPIDFLAKKLGRSYQQIQNYESGKHRIASSSLFVAAQALKFPIANFFPNGKVGKEEKVELKMAQEAST